RRHVLEVVSLYRFAYKICDSHRFPRFLGGSPNIAATSGSHIVSGWILPADLSDSSSQKTPCPSFLLGENVASATLLEREKLTCGFEPPRLCNSRAHQKTTAFKVVVCDSKYGVYCNGYYGNISFI